MLTIAKMFFQVMIIRLAMPDKALIAPPTFRLLDYRTGFHRPIFHPL
jgi:hypothetical protein